MKPSAEAFVNEAELVQTFLNELARHKRLAADWTVYPETAGWDLVLVHKSGMQLGIEAKLSLNAKVIDQALSGQHSKWGGDGPDWRAVLVPCGKVQLHLGRICDAIGIQVLTQRKPERHISYGLSLPDPNSNYCRWPTWCPATRLPLPDYIPDVSAGCASPIQLTPWKVKAIKLMIVLERQGFVTRSDIKAIEISPTRWTDAYNGFLQRSAGQFVKCSATPDLRAQHPVNYAQIEADVAEWGKCLDPFKQKAPDWLTMPAAVLAGAA